MLQDNDLIAEDIAPASFRNASQAKRGAQV